jgi:DNA-binding phage protein
VKHLDKALIASGLMLLLSGGIAAAALGSGGLPTVMAALPGDATLMVEHGPFGGPNFLSAAATYIGISEADLRTQLQANKSLADIAVAQGKTRDGLIAALTAAASKDIATLVDQKGLGPRPGGPGFGRGHHFEVGNPFAAAATYLGISESDLRTKLQSGQSLAQVAVSSGKSRDGLIKAIVDADTAKIDQAQKDGKITADQATQLKTNLTDRVTRMVDATGFGARGPHR